MPQFRPKAAFVEAQHDEKSGRDKDASKKYAKLADYLMRRGKPKEARTLINRAIKLCPTAPKLYLERAMCEMALERVPAAEEAISSFVQAALKKQKTQEYEPFIETHLKPYPALRELYYGALLELDRTQVGLYLGLARALVEQNRLEGAQGVLVEALQAGMRRKKVTGILREVLEARNQMEGLYYLQRFESGELSKKELVLLLSDSKHNHVSPPSSEKGEDLGSLIQELETELGIEAPETKAEVLPVLAEFREKVEPIVASDPKLRVDLALAYYEMGLVEAAREDLEQVDIAEEEYLEARCLLGEISFREGNLLEALEIYQACLRDDQATEPVILEAKYKLIEIYVRLEDLKRAWVHIEELSKTNANYRELKSIMDCVRKQIKTDIS